MKVGHRVDKLFMPLTDILEVGEADRPGNTIHRVTP